MRAARLPLVLFCAAALVCSAAACSGSTHKAVPKSTTTHTAAATSTATVGAVSVGIKLATLKPRSIAVGASAASNAPLKGAGRLVLRYVELASRDPLLRGPVAHTLSTLFTRNAAASLRGSVAQVIADGGIGPVHKSTNIQGTLHFTTLVGSDRRIAAIDATMQTVAFADTARGRVSIARGGDLLLMPTAIGWQIAGYDLTVSRTNLTTGTTTTTSATGGSKP